MENRCSICKVDLTKLHNQPSDSIQRVVWIAPGIPQTETLHFCVFCIERRNLGLIKGLESYKL